MIFMISPFPYDRLASVDEFFGRESELLKLQTITDLKLDAYLRKYIQERQNISYLFLDSKRHLLTSLFEYKAPLYELATHLELAPIQREEIYKYAKKYLKISLQDIEYIYQKSDGETKMIQQILHLLYLQKEETVLHVTIDSAVKEIINSKDSSYKLLFDTLGNNQKTALKIVGKYKKAVFVASVLSEYNIKKQTLQSSIDALLKKELVDREDERYFIPDRTFELWVERLI